MLSTNDQAASLLMPDAMASADDLRKRILHLRWMGLEDEAERLCILLAQTAVPDAILIEPRETD